jgi:hypothetical protein
MRWNEEPDVLTIETWLNGIGLKQHIGECYSVYAGYRSFKTGL